MMEFVEFNQGLDIASRVERETELDFFVLPFLLKEKQ